jgi:hypothetical protein
VSDKGGSFMKKKTTNSMGLYIVLALIAGVVGGSVLTRPTMRGVSDKGMQTGDFGYGKGVGQGQNMQPNRNNCLADDCLLVENIEFPAGALSENVKLSLHKAVADEYKALSFYEAVIAKFGSKRPFSMIKNAEEQHIATLKAIYDKYGISIPEKTMMGVVKVPATLQDACQAGMEAEIANATLYKNELLPEVKSYTDITMVFENLMNASQLKHLPAFERCK